MKVVLFCGGRGSATIIRALMRRPEIELTLLVNAYDDGQSTGALRRFIPGMLGPSDFRKNLSTLLGDGPLRELLEYRLTDETARALFWFTHNGPRRLTTPLGDWFDQIPAAQGGQLRELLRRFFDYAHDKQFDYSACALGNLFFAGAYLRDRDFNAAIAEMAGIVGSPARLLNVAQGDNRILAASKLNGAVLSSEAEIVGPQSASPIVQLCLLKDIPQVPVTPAFLADHESTPDISPQAARAIAQADLIIYGPGTQHSSLLPSYRIAAAALAQAQARVKALVVNLDSDHDIQGFSAGQIVDRALEYGAAVTHVLQDDNAALPPITGDSYQGAKVLHGAFADAGDRGLHDGAAVVRHLMALV